MSFENYRAMLALLLSRGSTPEGCLRVTCSPQEAFERVRSAAGRRRLSQDTEAVFGPVDWKTFEVQVAAVEGGGIRAVSWFDDAYPAAFRDIASPPPLLFCRGDVAAITRRGIAVVGTRKPSPGGTALARRLATALGENGVVVVSGLARGIDTAAHRGAVATAGGTVAVVGAGIDVPYPPENVELMLDIAKSGCVVSEQFMGMHPAPQVFPRRNRLISALSHAVVVVEGGLRSGALITARWALEQGRDVGAVPGFPGDYRSAGPNQLLRQGAFVVETAADVFEAVPRLGTAVAPDAGPSPAGGGAVLDALGASASHPDEIATATGLAIHEVLAAIAELEVAGRVVRDASGGVTKVRT